jgi:hypothetical protein
VPAQVTVEVLTSQDEFLEGEAMPVGVRIGNISGQTLKLGGETNWLTFTIEARDGMAVPKNGTVPVKGEFTIDSSSRATVHVDLAPYFQVPQPGHYKVTATINIPAWKRQIISDARGFDIIQGARIWEQDFGVPKAPGDTNPVPEMRKYALQEANYLRSRLTLYAQVTDESGKVRKVIAIGPMISFGQPVPQVDRMSNLHVLYQNGPNTFSYNVINPDGTIILRRTYDYTTRPRLTTGDDGSVSVTGGSRRVTRDDIPPPKTLGENVSGPPQP